MQWKEVQDLFPKQWVLLEELKSHYEGNRLIVDDVAVIRPIPESDIKREFFLQRMSDLFSTLQKKQSSWKLEMYHQSGEKSSEDRIRGWIIVGTFEHFFSWENHYYPQLGS